MCQYGKWDRLSIRRFFSYFLARRIIFHRWYWKSSLFSRLFWDSEGYWGTEGVNPKLSSLCPPSPQPTIRCRATSLALIPDVLLTSGLGWQSIDIFSVLPVYCQQASRLWVAQSGLYQWAERVPEPNITFFWDCAYSNKCVKENQLDRQWCCHCFLGQGL